MKFCPYSNSAICSSSEGELVMVTGDQEIFFFSVLLQKGVSRNLESLSKVFKRGVVTQQEACSNLISAPKEKKKGMFVMVVKDKGSKSKNKEEADVGDSCSNNIEDLDAIFSTVNFQLIDESTNTSSKNEENIELDIDDIDLEDPRDKPKGRNFSVLNKQNLGKKLQEFRGILKPRSEEKLDAGKEKNEDEKVTGAIDQIKKKYGYATYNESNAASIAKDKARDNVRKLQDTSARSSEMQDTARSFSSMAKELLRISQK